MRELAGPYPMPLSSALSEGQRQRRFWAMIYHVGDCTLDAQLYSVRRGGQTIRLRPKVFRMCLYLLQH
jgi:hypothetical protein